MSSKRNAENDARFTEILRQAHDAGMEAGEECQPTPVVFYPSGTDPRVTGERIDEGLCGFAWVSLRPATSSFARWSRVNKESIGGTIGLGVHKGYPTGLDFWVRHFDQSHARKTAYARAFAKVLRDHGFNAYPGDRLD